MHLMLSITSILQSTDFRYGQVIEAPFRDSALCVSKATNKFWHTTGVLTIRLHARGWVLDNIQEQVLEAAAQVPGRRLVGVPDGLQLLNSHQLIRLRWQACAAGDAVRNHAGSCSCSMALPWTMSGCSHEDAGALITSICPPIGWHSVCLSAASACSRAAT